LRAFKGKVKDEEVNRFLNAIASNAVPAPIGATASLIFAAIYGVVKCEPRDQHWKFDADVWGVGAAGIESVGFMYTAYENWDAFFSQTTAFHVQGVADAGGIFQISWFNHSGVPIGQFNGPAAGIALFEAGGSGKWKKK
jgi:hypothetical protein